MNGVGSSNRGGAHDRGGMGLMTRRPCIHTGCTHLAIPGKARCYQHQRVLEQAREATRPSRQQRGYDAEYERARAALHLEDQPPCHWCGEPASTADHDPPIHQVGVHYQLVPACVRCNFGRRNARTGSGNQPA